MKILTDYEQEDTKVLQRWFKNRGYNLTLNQCYEIWTAYSQEHYDASWIGFSDREDLYSDVIKDFLIPLIAELGEESVLNVFNQNGFALTKQQALVVAKKHSADNSFVGWQDTNDFDEKTFQQYLMPIAKELGIV